MFANSSPPLRATPRARNFVSPNVRARLFTAVLARVARRFAKGEEIVQDATAALGRRGREKEQFLSLLFASSVRMSSLLPILIKNLLRMTSKEAMGLE